MYSEPFLTESQKRMDIHEALWQTSDKTMALHHNDVHLWRISLEQPTSVLRDLIDTLSEDEIQRAQRFCFKRDRDRWIAARGFLRILLGLYLKVEPEQIHFTQTSHGKLSIENPVHGRELHFNLSHSNTLALYAFTYQRQVGVDVEYMRSEVDYAELTHQYFSPAEYQAFSMLPKAQRLRAFYRGWTSKEAYLKARGLGLSLGLDQFDVALRPDEPAGLLLTRDDPREVARWSLHELHPGLGCAGMLAVEGSACDLSYWQWPGHFACEREEALAAS